MICNSIKVEEVGKDRYYKGNENKNAISLCNHRRKSHNNTNDRNTLVRKRIRSLFVDEDRAVATVC